MDTVGILVIVFAVFALFALAILSLVIYNQMLLVNNVNKRLLLLTKEAVDKINVSMEELEEAMKQLEDRETPGVETPPTDVDREWDNDPHSHEVPPIE